MILGVHSSISGGLTKALEHTCMLGCNAVQIFHRNPRALRGRGIAPDDVEAFRKKKEAYGIDLVTIHAVYTQNLASASGRFYRLSVKEFIADMAEAHALGVRYVVTHLGSFKESTYKEGMGKVVAALADILKHSPDDVTILMENISGARNLIGGEFHQFAYILERLKYPVNVGLCLDTCHAWCYGYDIKTEGGLDKVVSEIDALVGIDRVKLVHLNDTKEAFGSKRDRHCNIGEGELGEDGIANIINHPKLRDMPFILETPKKEDDADDKNIALVRTLRKE
jgi:deoxyribonuclease-4